MIDFVTWPPFLFHHLLYKGGQVTKPIIVVKMPCKLLYIIQVKEFLITSWPYLISRFLIAYNHYNAATDWPHTFYSQAVFVWYCDMLKCLLHVIITLFFTYQKPSKLDV